MGCASCWKNIFGDSCDGSRISDLKKYFWWLLRWVKNLRSTACKHYRKCDVLYRYLHIELIWCLLMVQYLQNNVVMKWTTRFIRFTGWIPLKYGSTTTPPIIAHCQKTSMSSLVFHIAIPKTSNIRRTPSFYLLTDEFSKRVYYKTRLIFETRWYIGIHTHARHATLCPGMGFQNI